MKFTVNWLKNYIETDLSAEKLSDKLTMLGLEVDSIEPVFEKLDEIKIARVLKAGPHPNADKLTLCTVTTGNETVEIVCGAPNVRQGMVSAIAMPGTVLPSGIKIKPTKIRGEKSHGMLCSEKDLGIGESHDGIMDLDEELTIGASLADELALRDEVIEVDLTPNRPDCASVIGIARETGSFTKTTLKTPVDTASSLTGKNVPFSISIEAPLECPRYCARLITDVKIGPSPWWLKKLLLSVGIRSINNVVDITNFVMLEYGQPLHAFDFKKVADSKIIVRKARPGEKITTLDNTERELDQESLLICDGKQPVALAGIMGGANSEVSDSTKEILLESAYFNPVNIRRTARNLKIGTDSSYRFERGVDPKGVPIALERAVRLIQELAGGTVIDNGFDVNNLSDEVLKLNLRVKKTSNLLGMTFTASQLSEQLKSIEIPSEIIDEDNISVFPPSFRVDLEREIDLVEEIARLTGYNEIPTTLPSVPMSFSENNPERVLNKQITDIMVALGYSEAINYSFGSEKCFDKLSLAEDDPLRETIKIQNPLTEDQSVMRTMLIPGLLENLRHNINHQNNDVKLFEIGKVFTPVKGKEQPDENIWLSGVISGNRYPSSPTMYFANQSIDLFDIKAGVETILEQLRIDKYTLSPATGLAWVNNDNSMKIHCKKQLIGYIGEINNKTLKQFNIRQKTFFLDINLNVVLKLNTTKKSFKLLPKFPSVKWDLALIVPEAIDAGEIINIISKQKSPLIESIDIFDIYRGKPIDEGKKSIAFTITYRSDKKTLNDKTVKKVHQKITDITIKHFNAQLREV
jgi:phenylalanyl-tRNA synthetase beta chain